MDTKQRFHQTYSIHSLLHNMYGIGWTEKKKIVKKNVFRSIIIENVVKHFKDAVYFLSIECVGSYFAPKHIHDMIIDIIVFAPHTCI